MILTTRLQSSRTTYQEWCQARISKWVPGTHYETRAWHQFSRGSDPFILPPAMLLLMPAALSRIVLLAAIAAAAPGSALVDPHNMIRRQFVDATAPQSQLGAAAPSAMLA